MVFRFMFEVVRGMGVRWMGWTRKVEHCEDGVVCSKLELVWDCVVLRYDRSYRARKAVSFAGSPPNLQCLKTPTYLLLNN